MALAVLLTGDPTTLPRAEAEALLRPTGWVGDRVALCRDDQGHDAARLAYGRRVGVYWGEDEDTPEGHARLAAVVRERASGRGSAAVRSTRTGQEKSPHRHAVERLLGDALAGAGHPIDLSAPDVTLFAWFHAGRVVVGERLAEVRHDFDRRSVEHRAHFSPVGLHPRIALALVHLAAPREGARVHDPFCGTGGIVLEAALDGYDASGSDLDPWMVAGTLGTLTDDGPEPLDAPAFVADVADVPDLLGPGCVDAVVTDLPYGAASTTNREELGSLYDRAFAALARLLPPGRHAVFGCHDEALGMRAERHGFVVTAVHEQYVHRSLTRRFFLATRMARSDGHKQDGPSCESVEYRVTPQGGEGQRGR